MQKINTINDLRRKKVLVMGLGLIGGGTEVAKWLVKHGARVTITDLKDKKILAPSLKKLKGLPVKYVLAKHRPIDFIKSDLIIKNPDVPYCSPFLKIARKNHIPIETDLSLFFKFWPTLVPQSETSAGKPAQFIGITGTKGKSTTASLIYEILKNAKMPVKLAGNIGQTPLKNLNAKTLKSSNVIMILELSSFQLENLFYSPHIAVITNIYPDHLNRHKTMAGYLAAKMNILKYQTSQDFAILNYDNPLVKKMGQKVRGRLIWFTTKKITAVRPHEQFITIKNKKAILKSFGQEKTICRLAHLGLAGGHNLEHALAAIAVAHLFKVEWPVMEKFCAAFAAFPTVWN